MTEDRLISADMNCRKWIARLNELEECGVFSGKQWEEAERKSQYWLDRYNKLNGDA